MKLRDQFDEIHASLPADWDSVRLTLTMEQPGDLARAAEVLGPMGAGHSPAGGLTLTVRRAGGPAGPEAARRLFARLDDERVWCELQAGAVAEAAPAAEPAASVDASLAGSWDLAIRALPPDWSDLLCELTLESSALLPRAALLCAPLNPTRDMAKIAFTFRCAQRAGYGASPGMARRCLTRLDAEGIHGRVRILRVLAGTGLVATQGPVWPVGGKVL